MTAILILNRLPRVMAPYETWLQDYRGKVHFATNNKSANSFDRDFFATYRSYKKFQTNYNVEFDALNLHRDEPFDRIIALDEGEILRAADLRQYLGLPGQSLESAIAYRDKVTMKDYLKNSRVRVPRYQRINTITDIYSFIEEVGLPVVIKPTNSMASMGVSVIKTQDQLKNWLSSANLVGLEIEEYIEGQMYHIDGLMMDGQIKFVSVGKYLRGCLDFMDGGTTAYTLLSPQNPVFSRLVEITQQVISALPAPQYSTFHCEIFHTSEDELVFCEIASRTGGGMVHAAIEHSYGFDLNETWVRLECGLIAQPQVEHQFKEHTGAIFIPARSGTLQSIPQEVPFDWVLSLNLIAAPGQEFSNRTSYVQNLAIPVVKGNSEQQVQERLEELLTWMDENTVWATSSL